MIFVQIQTSHLFCLACDKSLAVWCKLWQSSKPYIQTMIPNLFLFTGIIKAMEAKGGIQASSLLVFDIAKTF